MADERKIMKQKLIAASILVLAFYYFVWPDSIEACLRKSAKEAQSNYGFKILAEMCTQPTWVDDIQAKLATITKSNSDGANPIPKVTIDEFLGPDPAKKTSQ